MQGLIKGAAQTLTQGFHNCTNLQDRYNASIMRHGLPNGLQASSMKSQAQTSSHAIRLVVNGAADQPHAHDLTHD